MDLKNITVEDLKEKFAAFDKKTLIKFGIGIGAIILFLIIYFAYCNFYLQEKRKYPFNYYFKNQTSLNLICDKNKIYYQDVSYKLFLQYYQNRFDDKFIEKLCLKS